MDIQEIISKLEEHLIDGLDDGIIKDVRTFMGNYPQVDDITLIVTKRTV